MRKEVRKGVRKIEKESEKGSEKGRRESSQVIGLRGEKHVAKILKQHYQVQDVSQEGRRGDMIISRIIKSNEIKLGEMLVEVKNYTSIVPAAEVDKFEKDIRSNAGIVCALFVSLHSDVSGVPGHFHFTQMTLEYKTIPVLYICSHLPEIILLGVQLLWTYADMRQLNSEEKHLVTKHLDKIYNKINQLSNHLSGLSMARRLLEEMREMLNSKMSRAQTNLFGLEMNIASTISDMKEIIGRIETIQIGSADVVIGTPVEVIESVLKRLKVRFSGAHLTNNRKYQFWLTSILSKFLGEDEVSINFDKKIRILRGSSVLVTIELLQTKTIVKLNAVNTVEDYIKIPVGLKFESGWITFILRKDCGAIIAQVEKYVFGCAREVIEDVDMKKE